MRVLIIDNYDSFTYNIYQSVGELLEEKGNPFLVDVIRNDKITLQEVRKRAYDKIILSPGPGDPSDDSYFGVCKNILLSYEKPILGICLGMQGIASVFGGKIIRADKPMHGKTSIIVHDKKSLFVGVPQGVEVMRYHSLVVDRKSLPECLEVSATATKQINRLSQFQEDAKRPTLRNEIHSPKTLVQQNHLSRANFNASEIEHAPATPHVPLEIMGLRHKKKPIEGVQFHPESFATEAGRKILANFLFGGGV